jgi:hypothetical protein
MNESPHRSCAPYYLISTELPDSYGEATLKVIPCNPFRVYVYWDLPEKAAASATRWRLRYFVNQTHAAAGSADVHEIGLPPKCREWYLDLPYSGASYSIELVGETLQGSETVVLKTGHHIPAASPNTSVSSCQSVTPPITCRPTDGLIMKPAAAENALPANAAPAMVGSACTDSGALLAPSSWALMGTSSQ